MLRIASLLASVCYLLLLTALPCVKAFADDAPASDYYLYKTINKSNGLSQLSVFDIKKDQQGYYWLATPGGLYQFDGISLKKINHYNEGDSTTSHFIRNITVDSFGTIWAGTQSGLIYKKKTSPNINVVDAFKNEIIWSIKDDKNHNYFISTQDALWYYNSKENKKSLIKKIKAIKSILRLNPDELLIGSYFDGLLKLNLKTKKIEKYSEFGNKVNKIKKIENSLYLASEQGLYEVNSNINVVRQYEKSYVNDFFIHGSTIFLAENNGLYEINKKSKTKLFDGKTWSLSYSNDQFLLGTHTEGLKEYQKKPSAIYTVKIKELGNQGYISHVGIDGKTVYLIDNKKNLYTYNRKKKIITRISNNKLVSVFNSDGYSFLVEKNKIILNSKNGNSSSILGNYDVLAFSAHNGIHFIDNNSNLYTIKNGKISAPYHVTHCDYGFANTINYENKTFYVGGDNGLCSINKNKEDKLNGLWIKGTINYNKTILFASKNGLILNENGSEIFDLKLDNSEELYTISNFSINAKEYIATSTSKGIRVYGIGKHNIHLVKTYDSRYALLNEYVANSYANDDSGDIFFGGLGGFSYITPRNLNISPQHGDILISNIKIYNEDNTHLLNEIKNNKKIKLESYQYPLTLKVSLLNYSFPDRAKMMYQISSYGKNWYYFDAINSITLSRLESGQHDIRFRALDDSKIVATSPIYTVLVLPPWWKSNTAYFLYSIFVLFIIILTYSILKNRKLQHEKIIESEERLKLALWGSGDELWDWDIKSGNIYRSNIWNTLLLPNDGFRGKDERNNIYKNDLPRVKSALEACLEGNQEEFEVAYRVQDKNENWIWILDRGRVVEYDDNGLPLRMTGTLKNISHLKKTEEMLKLLARCFTNISDAICIVTPDFIIQEVNDSFVQTTGIKKEKAIGKAWHFSLYSSGFLEKVKSTLDRYGRWHDEIEAQRQSGEIYPIDITIDKVFDEEKDDFNYVAVFSDISERKEKEKELERLTNTDTLTSLPNRSLFMSTLASLVRKAQPFALLVLDLNNFKQINDSLGHQFGDRLLIEASARLNKAMQSSHTLYRLGGDEFAVLIENATKLDEVTRLAIDMHQQLSQPIHIEGEELNMSCAIGAVIYPDDGATPEYLLRNADAAMYHAKHEDNKSCQFFSSSMNEQANARLAIENRIRKALRENLFEVYYQPKVDTQTSRCNGAEALLRLPDGKGGYISPVEFIPVAEESGLIIEVGNWVMEASCQQVKKWYDQGLFPGRIAINLSARQFRHSDLISVIDDVLVRTGLPTHILELEITEGAMMEDPKRAIATMNRMRERGITLAMDDFGTGYSSLSNLRQFPVTCIKIDRIFVKDLTTDESARSLTEGIIHLARTLGLHVVAEGVETIEQLAELKALQCPTCQGFLFGKPMPADEFEQKLNNRGGLLGPADVVDLKR